ncbi:hypothetical protein Goklo_000587, partial [Gossypium klotzschianum]|nr:hypothetical protein [Gossypium klotzschianum]
LQLGLSVDGSVPTRSAQSADWGAICYDILGAFPDNIYNGQIDMKWLQKTLPVLGDDLTEVQRVRYARGAAGELSLGSAALATLYWETCQITKPNKIKIGGRLALLQSWAQFRFSFLCLRVDHPYTFPFVTR